MPESISTSIRLPADLKKELEAMAAADSRSLNNLIVLILSKYVREQKQ